MQSEDLKTWSESALLRYMEGLSEREEWTPATAREFDAAKAEYDKRMTRKAATARPVKRLEPGEGGGGEGTGALFRTVDGREIRAFKAGDHWPHAGDGEGVGLADVVRAQLTGGRVPGVHAMARAHSAGEASSGGVWLPSPVSAQLNDILRNTAGVTLAGAQVVPVEAGRLTLVRLDSDPTASWKAENAAGAHSEATFSAVHLTTRMLWCSVKISLELATTAPNFEGIIRTAIAEQMALALDAAALTGTGANAEPLGILSDAAVPGIAHDAALADYSPFVAAIGRLRAQNVPESSMHAIVNADVATKADGLLDTTDQPQIPPRPVAAMQASGRWHVSNQIPTVPTSPPESTALFGDFGTGIVIGMTGGMRLEASLEAADSTGSAWAQGQVWIRAAMLADVAIIRPSRFCRVTGINVA